MNTVTLPKEFAQSLLSYFYEKHYGEVEQVVAALRYFMSQQPTEEVSNGDGSETESAS